MYDSRYNSSGVFKAHQVSTWYARERKNDDGQFRFDERKYKWNRSFSLSLSAARLFSFLAFLPFSSVHSEPLGILAYTATVEV